MGFGPGRCAQGLCLDGADDRCIYPFLVVAGCLLGSLSLRNVLCGRGGVRLTELYLPLISGVDIQGLRDIFTSMRSAHRITVSNMGEVGSSLAPDPQIGMLQFAGRQARFISHNFSGSYLVFTQ